MGLGFLYETGQGVPKNATEAARWFGKAGGEANPEVQFQVGNLHYTVNKDYVGAASWFRKAAEQGHAGSQLFLGVMYKTGQGLPQDYIKAYLWLSLASSNDRTGNPMPRRLLEDLGRQMTPVQLDEARRLTRETKPLQKKQFRFR